MQSSFPFPSDASSIKNPTSKWESYVESRNRLRELDPHYYNDSDSTRLKADGNLTYLGFIEIVRLLWESSYPDIPIIATFGGKFASYPCIAYGLELKRAHNSEPKPRYRDKGIDENGKYYFIEGQRFQNVVSFTVMTESDAGRLSGDPRQYVGAEVADRIIEIFEDFMLEYTPVFKKLGASELVYARRVSDTEINLNQTDVVKRTVTYLLTTEKIHVSSVEKIENMVIDIRQWISYEKNLVDATPSFNYNPALELNIIDLKNSATPNY
ncbi:hypothetical protein [Flavobacterium sp.]|uniref:hypothetical protein n=1 Tax=Flavobacterium sp. TaxID=239 RepID=UPI003BBF06E0